MIKSKFLILLLLPTIHFAQNIVFNDLNFKNKLLQANSTNFIAKDLNANFFKIDANNDGEIQVSEAQEVSYLNISSSNVTNLTDIEYFINIEYLHCNNNFLTNLLLSQNAKLKELSCYNNNLSELNIDFNPQLFFLQCSSNQLSNLNVSNNLNLHYISCDHNNLTSLNVSQNLDLTGLRCCCNSLTNLDVTNNTHLLELSCFSNPINEINITQNIDLSWFECGGSFLIQNLNLSNNLNLEILAIIDTSITDLDLSNNLLLNTFHCSNSLLYTLDLNPFTNLNYLVLFLNQNLNSLYIKNNSNETILELYDNPNLNFICADDFQIDTVTSIANNGAIVTDNCSLNNNDNIVQSPIALSPNPTSSKVTINSNYTIKSIELFDIQGRLINFKLTNSTQVDLDLSIQSTGMYFVKVSTEKGFSIEKVVKQ